MLLDAFVAELCESEPEHRPVRQFLAVQALQGALADVPAAEQLALLVQIREARAAEIAREMQREQGRFLRGLNSWLAQRGWRDFRPAAQTTRQGCTLCSESGIANDDYCTCAAGAALRRSHGR